jgi:anti-sigma B factor antagonist
MLNIHCEADGDGHAIVTASGQVDLATGPQLAEALAQVDRDGAAAIVVDLSAVDFLDSAGVRVLVEAARRGNGSLTVRGAQGWVARVLDITGVSEYLSPRAPDPAGGVLRLGTLMLTVDPKHDAHPADGGSPASDGA